MQYGYKFESIRIHVLSLFLSHSFSFIYIYPLTITDTYSLTHLPTNEEGHRHHGRPEPERRRRLASGTNVCRCALPRAATSSPLGGSLTQSQHVSTGLNHAAILHGDPWNSPCAIETATEPLAARSARGPASDVSASCHSGPFFASEATLRPRAQNWHRSGWGTPTLRDVPGRPADSWWNQWCQTSKAQLKQNALSNGMCLQKRFYYLWLEMLDQPNPSKSTIPWSAWGSRFTKSVFQSVPNERKSLQELHPHTFKDINMWPPPPSRATPRLLLAHPDVETVSKPGSSCAADHLPCSTG